jgi:hypothetical protein
MMNWRDVEENGLWPVLRIYNFSGIVGESYEKLNSE